jgi:hypothetical protein
MRWTSSHTLLVNRNGPLFIPAKNKS